MTPPHPPQQPTLSGPDHPPVVLSARLLGPVHLAVGSRELGLGVWPRRSARSLLLLLLMTPGHRIARERAVDLLWPELPEDRARNTWYQTLSTLRRVLEPNLGRRQASAFVTADAATIALAEDLALWVDVDAFEAALLRSADTSSSQRRAALRSAVSLYGGDLLAEEPAADWAIARRQELHAAWQRAVLELADLDLQAGEPLASVAALQAVQESDRTAENVHRALIRAFLAAGERDPARRQLERCRQALWEELGVEPSHETASLLDDSGAWRQLTPAVTDTPVASRLPPAPATPLVGRDSEIAAVEDRLWRSDVRLVTLTGPGGIGKTRLAIEVARRVHEEGKTVVFVPLAGVQAPDLFLAGTARVLDARDEGEDSLLAAVRRRICQRDLLLVLDNFEHVAAAAVVLSELLAACQSLTVLVTSRIPLHLAGEHVVTVPPLALPGSPRPSAAALERSDAVRLFVQRARAAKSDFALTTENGAVIAQLCARLDGLPLAIELAAARVRALSPRAMLARLEQRLDLLSDGPADAPLRLRTMRDAIGWSYDLLGEREKATFRRLAVFADGASLPAARWVATEDADEAIATGGPPAVPEVLTALIDHSLLQQEEQADGEPRFSLLETVRAYAMERLLARGEADETHRRHLAWLIAFARVTAPTLTRSAQSTEVEQLAAEIDNIRAALSWALTHGEVDMALALSVATFQLWFVRGLPAEGRRWIEASLAAATNVPDRLRADVLLCACALAFLHGDLVCHEALARESLAITRASGYELGAGIAQFQLGVAAERRCELDDAAARYEQALRLMRRLGEPYWIALLLSSLGDISLWRGDSAKATVLASEGLARWREIGNEWGIAQGLGTMAGVAHHQGDYRRAADLYLESLTRWASLGDRRGIAGTLAGIAGLAGSVGAPSEAARLLGAAHRLGASSGVHHLAHHGEFERVLHATRAQLAETVFAHEWQVGEALSFGQAIAAAWSAVETATAGAPHARGDEAAADARSLSGDVVNGNQGGSPTNVVPLRHRPRAPRRA